MSEKGGEGWGYGTFLGFVKEVKFLEISVIILNRLVVRFKV